MKPVIVSLPGNVRRIIGSPSVCITACLSIRIEKTPPV